MTMNTDRHAVVVHRTSDGINVSCDTLPQPVLPDTSLKIRPAYIGICGSDLEQIYGSVDASFHVTFPHVLGHEWSGVVVEAGLLTARFRPGIG